MHSKPFIVAELSANHLGGFMRALKLIDAAKEAGADGVKFQTYDPDEMVGPHDYVIPGGPWAGRKLIDLYREAMTPRKWHRDLFAYARALEIEPFSTPFSKADVDFLEGLGCARYKIASFELVDHGLIEYAAKTGKPLIISTGMATEEEVFYAANAATQAGCNDLTLLKCTSGYPAPLAEVNLATMPYLATFPRCTAYGVSDHTEGIAVPVAAVALGASMVEKHLTLARADGGPDASFSLEPAEFKEMVASCRAAALAVGRIQRLDPTPSEGAQRALRRSLYFSRDLQRGDIVKPGDLRTARPALGLEPRRTAEVLGRTLERDVKAGEPVRA